VVPVVPAGLEVVPVVFVPVVPAELVVPATGLALALAVGLGIAPVVPEVVPVVPVVPVVRGPVVVPVVPEVPVVVPVVVVVVRLGSAMFPASGPQALSQLPRVRSSRCIVSTWSRPGPQSM
jgi:hypothetical protein